MLEGKSKIEVDHFEVAGSFSLLTFSARGICLEALYDVSNTIGKCLIYSNDKF